MENTYRHVQYNKWESVWSCLASSSWWLSISVSLTTTSRGLPAPRVSKQLPDPEEKNKAVVHKSRSSTLPFMEPWRGAISWHRYSWKHVSLMTVVHVDTFALPTDSNNNNITRHTFKKSFELSVNTERLMMRLIFYSPAWLITRSACSMSSAIELLNR